MVACVLSEVFLNSPVLLFFCRKRDSNRSYWWSSEFGLPVGDWNRKEREVLLSTLALRVRSMDPLKDFHKTVLSLDNCIIPNERLIHTPSSRDGVSHDLEVDLRIVGCEYIQSAGLLLRLPQVGTSLLV